MGNTKKIVGLSLAVALAATLAVYVLIPRTGPNTANVVTNEPQTPGNGGSNPAGGGGTQPGGGGTTPTPDTRPAKLHGQNSQGPKHAVCLAENDHVANGVAQYQGANWYRGTCGSSPSDARNSHASGHVASGSVSAITAAAVRPATGG